MPRLTWKDADEIGYLLSEQFSDQDPLAVRFGDLRERVMKLEGFADRPEASNESVLEAIQMSWLEYYRENHQG